eukprot:747493-Amphidinium_carterae.1
MCAHGTKLNPHELNERSRFSSQGVGRSVRGVPERGACKATSSVLRKKCLVVSRVNLLACRKLFRKFEPCRGYKFIPLTWVARRWYRAPEVLCSWLDYGKAGVSPRGDVIGSDWDF